MTPLVTCLSYGMNNITIDNFRSWLNSLPAGTTFDSSSTVYCAAARFFASCVGASVASVYTPAIGNGAVYTWSAQTARMTFEDDNWFAQYARWEYQNRVKSVDQALKFYDVDSKR